jgi:tetratricopeptide (TPR) repeat protein
MEDALGHFDRQVPLLERQLALARTMGSMQRAGRVLCWLAHVHEALGDYAAALDRFEEGLPLILANGDRTFEALARSGVGRLHFKRGDITKALQWLTQAQDVFDALEPSTDGDENHACVALCHIRLGERDAALSIANTHLNQVQATLTRETAYATLQLRWTCQQVLEESGDAIRAALLLQQLFLDVQARAAELTDATDRERLIKAMPVFRDIVAAHARLSSTQPD